MGGEGYVSILIMVGVSTGVSVSDLKWTPLLRIGVTTLRKPLTTCRRGQQLVLQQLVHSGGISSR